MVKISDYQSCGRFSDYKNVKNQLLSGQEGHYVDYPTAFQCSQITQGRLTSSRWHHRHAQFLAAEAGRSTHTGSCLPCTQFKWQAQEMTSHPFVSCYHRFPCFAIICHSTFTKVGLQGNTQETTQRVCKKLFNLWHESLSLLTLWNLERTAEPSRRVFHWLYYYPYICVFPRQVY